MKKLILLSLSAFALAMSINAAPVSNFRFDDPELNAKTERIIKRVASSDLFAGIELTEEQSSRLEQVLGGVVASEPSRDQSQKVVAQIKKILTPQQYTQFLENAASGATSQLLMRRR